MRLIGTEHRPRGGGDLPMPGVLEELGTLSALPPSQAHSLFPPSPFSSTGSLTHSLSNFSGSFMHLPAPSSTRSLVGEHTSSLTLLIEQTLPEL